nr:MAG TPA: hypothetical protein [Caudoviricetes sp.]
MRNYHFNSFSIIFHINKNVYLCAVTSCRCYRDKVVKLPQLEV